MGRPEDGKVGPGDFRFEHLKFESQEDGKMKGWLDDWIDGWVDESNVECRMSDVE
jgi:hypothetical protein